MSREKQGLLIPLRRDKKKDLATGRGAALLASKVRQVLLTQGDSARSAGELPWRTAFGAGLELLRHRPLDAAFGELARVSVRAALGRWLPGVEVLEVLPELRDSTVTLRIRIREAGEEASVAVPLGK